MKLQMLAPVLFGALYLGACAPTGPMPQPPIGEVLREGVGPLALSRGTLITHNDAALDAKLGMIADARESLDLAYYIFSDDYSSALLTQALIDAAQRGVQVRLLLDYFSAYRDLDRFTWLEREGHGNIEVRLYNRPTLEIIKDAAFLTTSCVDVGAQGKSCDEEKIRAVDRHFEPDHRAGTGVSNRTLAGSGVFLSGLYGKHPQLMAYAVTRGQAIDPEALTAGAEQADAEQAEQLKRLGRLYFRARYMSGMDALAAKFKLAFVRLTFAEQVNPVFDTVNTYLPLARQNDAQAQRDWDYLTEFLHHKLLLADGSGLILGGRNVEDSYHMQPGPLSDKYTFRDSDVALHLQQAAPALTASFDRLWQFRNMVASLEEVRRHAPNDLLMNFDVLEAALEACDQGRDASCVERRLEADFIPLEPRLSAAAERHRQHVDRYLAEYDRPEFPVPMTIDTDAEIYYLENLPLVDGRRGYGVRHDREAAAGKHIHATWRAAMQAVCAANDATEREIVFHNAYLFLPANLLQDIAAMLDGTRPCAGVRLSLLTNSLETTDLNVVNLLATWQLKALADHLEDKGGSRNAASLGYYEYRSTPGSTQSLHAKVMVFGDDIYVGSANADVRSLVLDTNNGLFIRNAPVFAEAYRGHLRELMSSPAQVTDATAGIGRDAAELSAEMHRSIDQLLDRYAGPERLTSEQRQELRQRVEETAQRVYDLSRRIMRGDSKAADTFNDLFKVI